MSEIYTNTTVPEGMALLFTDNDIFDMLRLFVGDIDNVLDASTGSSPFGPYDEGDIEYRKGGDMFTLSYDFMLLNDMARIFRYWVTAK